VSGPPLVSICVPVFNGAAHIDACIAAVMAQSYANLEIVVVDNHSSDDTVDRLHGWAAADRRVRFQVNPSNIGAVRNRNACATLAKGEWIKFLDHDDLLEPTCVERLVETVLLTESSLGACRRLVRYEGVDDVRIDDFESETMRFELRRILPGLTDVPPFAIADVALRFRGRNFVGEPIAVLVRRAAFQAMGGFNADLVQIPDLECWLRIGLSTGLSYVDEPLCTFRVHATNESAVNHRSKLFRASRLDQVILLHEYLYNPRYLPLRRLAAERGTLKALYHELRHQARRLAVRAVIDRRSADPRVRQETKEWAAVARRYAGLRLPGAALSRWLAGRTASKAVIG
jgi:glycosyltransferase involved in cell wall biosynthesis